MNKYLYGDSWEKYSIEEGEIWTEKNTMSILQVKDIYNGIPDFILNSDLLYSDPPWNTGNINSFYTKAGINKKRIFNEFANVIFNFLMVFKKTCYLEIGKQNLNFYLNELSKIYKCVQHWEIKYYNKNACYLLRCGKDKCNFDFFGYDDSLTPNMAIQYEKEINKIKSVSDFCMGRGITAVAAYKNNIKFSGIELNKRRLACTIDKIEKLGGRWESKKVSL